MWKLFQYQCSSCQHEFEDLHQEGEPLPACPLCNSEGEIMVFCNKPTNIQSPKQAEIMSKGKSIRNKLEGKVPWRKSSYSQSD